MIALPVHYRAEILCVSVDILYDFTVGVHDALFVATNVDRSNCLHIALGAVQR